MQKILPFWEMNFLLIINFLKFQILSPTDLNSWVEMWSIWLQWKKFSPIQWKIICPICHQQMQRQKSIPRQRQGKIKIFKMLPLQHALTSSFNTCNKLHYMKQAFIVTQMSEVLSFTSTRNPFAFINQIVLSHISWKEICRIFHQ